MYGEGINMKYYICEYAKFLCGIGVLENEENQVLRFMQEFNFYYDIQKTVNILQKCDSRIYIVDDAYEGIVDSNEECIHSSHSKNIKYLLDGSLYTQKDASVFAYVRRAGEKIFYYIKKTKTKVLVDINKKSVLISGGNLYNMFVYVYETLLSISIEHKGGIQFHGACFQWNENGYIVTGKSGGGKTTLMFNALKLGGRFHSNDRVAVYEEEDGIIAYSIPIPVNVPINIMRTLDDWKNTDLVRNAADNSKIRFMVPQFTEIFHDNMIRTVRIDKIIVVCYSDNQPSYEVIENGKLTDYLEILSPYDENHPKWLPIFHYPDEDMVENKLERLRERLIVCRISGRNTFETFLKES